MSEEAYCNTESTVMNLEACLRPGGFPSAKSEANIDGLRLGTSRPGGMLAWRSWMLKQTTEIAQCDDMDLIERDRRIRR